MVRLCPPGTGLPEALRCDRVVGGGFLVVGGRLQSRGFASPTDAVELQAPGDQDLAGLGAWTGAAKRPTFRVFVTVR
jgi:hypothetical protein